MGASSSSDHKDSVDLKEAEALAVSSGALSLLQTCFSTLADPQRNAIPLESLKRCFDLSCKNLIGEAPTVPQHFLVLLEQIGASIVDLFFVSGEDGVSWLEFLRGYNKCCARMSSSMAINNLLRVFSLAAMKSGAPLSLEFEAGDGVDCKISGLLVPAHVVSLLLLCWSMAWDSQGSKSSVTNGNLRLPDLSHLAKSALISCAEDGVGLDSWECDVSGLEAQLPVGKFLTWVLQTLPSLPDCFAQLVHARISSRGAREDDNPESSCSSAQDILPDGSSILSRGIAWAISLTVRGTISEELSHACFSSNLGVAGDNLLYRSSQHGRGLNRFWSNVEGYQGPLLVLIHAASEDNHEDKPAERKWTVGALTQQGFENAETFYGSSGHLYSLCPVFHAYSSAGKEKNLVYSHLHTTGKKYEPHPKPVGLAFGGTVGNERVFVDEDFSKVIVRHHAVDKTYQHGFLFPDQGYLPVEALILDVEVWGLGGKRSKLVQDKYKRREELFTEQRRKVDLKTFSNWEDSPEKMMMDMMGDPNAVRREER